MEGFGDNGLKALAAFSERLQELRLGGCEVSDDGLEKICLFCNELRLLEVTKNDAISSTSLSHLCTDCTIELCAPNGGARARCLSSAELRQPTAAIAAPMAPSTAIGAPSPVIACLGGCTLLLDHIQGEPLSTLSPESDESRALYLRAGALLRRLHQLPAVDEDPLPLRMAIRKREGALLTWLSAARSESSIMLALKREVNALFSLAESLHQRPLPAQLSRVPTHRDLRPEHILWSRSTDQLTLIDFSQSRLDWCAADLVKLYEPDEPIELQSRMSFFEGYQSRLNTQSDRGAEIMNAPLLIRARFFFQLASLRWYLRAGETQRIWAIRSAIDTIVETLRDGNRAVSSGRG